MRSAGTAGVRLIGGGCRFGREDGKFPAGRLRIRSRSGSRFRAGSLIPNTVVTLCHKGGKSNVSIKIAFPNERRGSSFAIWGRTIES